MNNKRLLFVGMVALTLGIGVILGSIVSGGVKATFEQKAAAIAIPDPVSLSNTFSQIAAQMDAAVVKITVKTAPRQTRNPSRNGGRQPVVPSNPFDFFNFGIPDEPVDRGGIGTGTGFIVDKSGFILTNHHVVDNAVQITVDLSDGSSHTGTVVGSDEGTDLAVLKIAAGRDLSTAKFGNSDAVKVGDWVLAIGSPFGFDHSVTAGIISAKGRDNGRLGAADKNNGLQRLLQTDAAINPGNSGGPLVNMAGEVIGVNTAIVSETNSFAGLGFALPSNTAVKVYNQLSQSGKMTRGSIGISYHGTRDPKELEAYGLKGPEAIIVDGIYPGSPAEKAGLQEHDVITEIDGIKLASGNQLQDYIVDRPIGSTVKLGWVHAGKNQSATVTIGDRATVLAEGSQAEASAPRRNREPLGRNEDSSSSHLGITVEPLTTQMMRQLSLRGGVQITKVDEKSVAEEAGLGEGMIVTGVVTGGVFSPINNIMDFTDLDRRLRSGSSVVLSVRVPDNQYSRDISIPVKVK
jgi:serine protease Do